MSPVGGCLLRMVISRAPVKLARCNRSMWLGWYGITARSEILDNGLRPQDLELFHMTS
jgi:hypothetical protein